MKKTINLYDFEQAFKRMDRDYYSREGYEAMFNFYEELEQDTEQETELDVIAFCGEWTEYDVEDLLSDYGYKLDADEVDDMDDEERAAELVKLLEDETTVFELSNGCWLVMAF